MTYETKWYGFEEHPKSDSCWSLSTGPDGRIYAAACCEHTPGSTVKITRYNEKTDALDYLFDMDEVLEDPRDSGRATQCKVHYAFAPSMADNVMYMATHLSGAPFDLPAYSPWAFWHDPQRCFRGSGLVAYDTKKDQVLWWDTLFPKEGCRCLLHDEHNGLLYSLSYPRDHMWVFDIEKRKRRDLGRIGSVNAQALFLDARHRVWTTSDAGHIVRYDPAKDRLEWSPDKLPHEKGPQTGWHNVFYDVAAAPDRPCVYAIMWVASPHLIRIWTEEGEWGRYEDLGLATLGQRNDPTIPVSTNIDHAGGLVFAGDGKLYFGAARWHDPNLTNLQTKKSSTQGVLWRMDQDTLEREELAIFSRPEYACHYVSRGAVDKNGELFFAHIGTPPAGISKVFMPADRKKKNAHLPIRMWG